MFMNVDYAQELIEKTQSYYEHYGESFAASRQKDWPLFLSLLQYIKKGDKVLDLGCGNGRLYPLVRQRGAEYLGIDLSAKILAEARRMYQEAEFREGNILDLKFPAASFNVVFLIAVLHHIPTKELRKKAVKNIYRILKPEGYLLISNWNLFQKRFWTLRLAFNFKKLLAKSKLDWNDLIYPVRKDGALDPALSGRDYVHPRPFWTGLSNGVFKKRRYYHGFKKREIAKLLQNAGFQILENYYEWEGKRVRRWRGENLVTVAKKFKM